MGIPFGIPKNCHFYEGKWWWTSGILADPTLSEKLMWKCRKLISSERVIKCLSSSSSIAFWQPPREHKKTLVLSIHIYNIIRCIRLSTFCHAAIPKKNTTGTSWAFFSASRSFSAKIRDTALVTISWETMAKPWENMEKPPKNKGGLGSWPQSSPKSFKLGLSRVPTALGRSLSSLLSLTCLTGPVQKPTHWITSRGTSRSLHDPTSHGLLKISMDTPCSYTPATVPHSSLAFWVRDFSNHFVLGHLQYSVHPKYCIYISIMYRHMLNHGLL